MTTYTDYSSLGSAQRFGVFMGELISKVGSMLGSFSDSFVTKISTSRSPVAKKINDFFQTNKDTIASGAYVGGAVYNFYTNPAFFLAGVVAGFVASSSDVPFDFKSLRSGELCNHSSKAGYAGPKAMFTIGAINLYLGNTFLDNLFFSSTAGLLVGNSLYQNFQDQKIVKSLQGRIKDFGDFVVKLPFLKTLFETKSEEIV